LLVLPTNIFKLLVFFEVLIILLLVITLLSAKLFNSQSLLMIGLSLFIISASELSLGLLLMYYYYTLYSTINILLILKKY